MACLRSGVRVKTWNIHLVDDGLEENHETFTVTLKKPQNAVLGQQTSASVEIIDPRGGWSVEGAALSSPGRMLIETFTSLVVFH